jgi:hypothetical protein
MRLDEFIEGYERDEAADLRKLAEEKSYAITEYIDDAETGFTESVQGDSLFGSTAPSIFVGRSGYPEVATGLLSPVAGEFDPTEYTTSSDWYAQGVDIDGVFQRRTGLLNSTRYANVDVADTWDGFVGVQREVAIADRPVDVEIGLSGTPNLDVSESLDATGMRAPNGPRVKARNAELTENPHVPRAVEKTLSDDDWRAEGAIAYLYRRGFDVYDIKRILSAGALGRAEERRLVPTRWSITAVDDTVGQYLRGRIRNAPSVDEVEVWRNDYVGNTYWVVLAPGDWEFELVEMKAPGSIWNPDESGPFWVGSDYENYTGRTAYVDETSGAYYASRLGVLEELERRGRQAKVLVLRTVSDAYWAPVGVWQIRESVRNAFEGEAGVAETFHDAVNALEPQLPISPARLSRKSEMVAGVQTNLGQFGG